MDFDKVPTPRTRRLCPHPRFVGSAGQDIPWNQNELLELAKEELNLTLGITAEPILSRVFMWDKAMPQYNLGHPEILKRIDAELENIPVWHWRVMVIVELVYPIAFIRVNSQ